MARVHKKIPLPTKPPDLHCRAELDSHADTCLFGSNCLVVQDTGNIVTLTGYNSTVTTNDIASVVTAAVAYDCPLTHSTYILFFPQVLYVPTLPDHLLNPFQMREYGTVVHKVPLLHFNPGDRAPELRSVATRYSRHVFEYRVGLIVGL